MILNVVDETKNSLRLSKLSFVVCWIIFFAVGCASYLKYNEQERLKEDEEFAEALEIKDVAPPVEEKPADASPEQATSAVETSKDKQGDHLKVKDKDKQEVGEKEKQKVGGEEKAKTDKETKKDKVAKNEKHQNQDKKRQEQKSLDVLRENEEKPRLPKQEDAEGFVGRRPLVDPFRLGEKTTFALTWFNIAAGYFTMEVKPFKLVNNNKSYHFYLTAKSSSFFSHIYKVDDWAETFVDYDLLIPYSAAFDVRESGQLKNLNIIFDHQSKRAKLWEKKYTKKKGHQERKKQWKLDAFAQNVLSAAFYLRNFTLRPGKKIAFTVSDEGKNYVFKGEVLRRETLKTAVGDLNTLVVKPQFEVDGVFKPTGENMIWLTDDDRKFIVRFESKIRIGSIVGQLKALDKGQ